MADERLRGRVVARPSRNERTLNFDVPGGKVVVDIKQNDRSGRPYTITGIDVSPKSIRREGHGTRVVDSLTVTARDRKAGSVVAQKVLTSAESFWQKLGFVRVTNRGILDNFEKKLK